MISENNQDKGIHLKKLLWLSLSIVISAFTVIGIFRRAKESRTITEDISSSQSERLERLQEKYGLLVPKKYHIKVRKNPEKSKLFLSIDHLDIMDEKIMAEASNKFWKHERPEQFEAAFRRNFETMNRIMPALSRLQECPSEVLGSEYMDPKTSEYTLYSLSQNLWKNHEFRLQFDLVNILSKCHDSGITMPVLHTYGIYTNLLNYIMMREDWDWQAMQDILNYSFPTWQLTKSKLNEHVSHLFWNESIDIVQLYENPKSTVVGIPNSVFEKTISKKKLIEVQLKILNNISYAIQRASLGQLSDERYEFLSAKRDETPDLMSLEIKYYRKPLEFVEAYSETLELGYLASTAKLYQQSMHDASVMYTCIGLQIAKARSITVESDYISSLITEGILSKSFNYKLSDADIKCRHQDYGD